MLSQTAEYALRAIVCLGRRFNEPLSTQRVAELTGVPTDYMSKVLQALGRHGLVRSSPGRNGGFLLVHAPEKMSILDVVDAVDPLQRIEHCPLNPKVKHSDLCPLHRELDKAIATVREAFAKCKVSDLVGGKEHQSLCTLVGKRGRPAAALKGSTRRR